MTALQASTFLNFTRYTAFAAIGQSGARLVFLGSIAYNSPSMLARGDTMAYQALYRTYRPQRFDQVVGQEAVIRTLAT